MTILAQLAEAEANAKRLRAQAIDAGLLPPGSHFWGKSLEACRDLAAKGYTQTEAAEKLGLSPQRISQLAIKYRINFKSGKTNDVLRAKLIKLQGEGLTVRQMAERLGETYTAVLYNVRRYGLTSARWVRSKPTVDKIVELAAQGLSVSDVAKELDIPQSSVSRAKKKYSIIFTKDGRAK